MEHLGLSQGFILAFVQVVLIDLVMSDDNAVIIGLAVAGLPQANRTRILDRHHSAAWIGFALILCVAGDMIWDGAREVVDATRKA